MLREKKVRGQVSLELATAFFCAFLILLACVKISAWVAGRIVVRQEDYEASRIEATDTNIGKEVDESNYKKLDIFN